MTRACENLIMNIKMGRKLNLQFNARAIDTKLHTFIPSHKHILLR
jgi:hypothetical protein